MECFHKRLLLYPWGVSAKHPLPRQTPPPQADTPLLRQTPLFPGKHPPSQADTAEQTLPQGRHPPWADKPLGRPPPGRHPPGRQPPPPGMQTSPAHKHPPGQIPPGQTLPGQTHSLGRHPSPPADGYCSAHSPEQVKFSFSSCRECFKCNQTNIA